MPMKTEEKLRTNASDSKSKESIVKPFAKDWSKIVTSSGMKSWEETMDSAFLVYPPA